ncbi:hypothetical protein OJAV_G00201610 [Oryzias javanicus]|uniref:Uncharacterized protein n=1 Tax=Oryzias javanicus TaxID=123683 RepID=A0A437C8W1_ORYJA|nr:hypothetical protein OJAV_G00201610 [Oryzias javanicus]
MCIRTPQKVFPSAKSCPLLCTDSTLCSPTPVMLRNDRAIEDQLSKSLEWMNTLVPGSWADEQQEAGRNESKSPDTLEGKAILQCCCSCHHPQNCCGRKYSHPHHMSCSIEEWEKMMEGLQHFHSVFNNMVKKFSEEQAAVYGMFSDTER